MTDAAWFVCGFACGAGFTGMAIAAHVLFALRARPDEHWEMVRNHIHSIYGGAR